MPVDRIIPMADRALIRQDRRATTGRGIVGLLAAARLGAKLICEVVWTS